jgi:hypothetical protein
VCLLVLRQLRLIVVIFTCSLCSKIITSNQLREALKGRLLKKYNWHPCKRPEGVCRSKHIAPRFLNFIARWVDGQLHASAASPPMNSPMVSFRQETGWAPEPFWALYWTDGYLTHSGSRNTFPRTSFPYVWSLNLLSFFGIHEKVRVKVEYVLCQIAVGNVRSFVGMHKVKHWTVWIEEHLEVIFMSTVHFGWLMFISVPTNAHSSSINLTLKLLRQVSMFLHHPEGGYKLCQLKLWIPGMIKYNWNSLLLTSAPHTPNQHLNYICGHILPTVGFYHNNILLYIILSIQ